MEIGDQEGFGFVVRAIGYGDLDFEDDTPETLAEAMAALEACLARWFEEQAVELGWAVRRGSARRTIVPPTNLEGVHLVILGYGSGLDRPSLLRRPATPIEKARRCAMRPDFPDDGSSFRGHVQAASRLP